MKKQILLLFAIGFILFHGCVKEDYFGLSPYGNIKTIEVSNQASQAVFNTQDYEIDIDFPPGVELSNIQITSLTLSSYAISDKQLNDILDLNQNDSIQVTAEDGTKYTWIIKPSVASSTPQLPDSDFEDWYQTSSGYYEPGTDASTTVWGTGNAGTQILNLLATTPIELSPGNKAANLQTLDNGSLAAGFGTPISAGSIFTGKFNKDNIDPTDSQAAIDFGTPFTGRPQKMNIKYSYTPGATNKDSGGNVLPDPDQCDIYCLLEVRTATATERLATAWFRSSDTIEDLTDLQMDFAYGPLDDSYPDYMRAPGTNFVSADSASFVLPTHITFVATSSFCGANFSGAIGSVLNIDELEFVY
ncbi:MAG: PCMD domain-containing protein [Bacteroidales bacterium]|nr:PCMD domain-containing protein [Bacteroidales bacterium]